MKRNKRMVKELRMQKKIEKREEEKINELLERVRRLKEMVEEAQMKEELVISPDGLVMTRSNFFQEEDSRYIRR